MTLGPGRVEVFMNGIRVVSVLVTVLLFACTSIVAAGMDTATPPPLVDSYDSLADAMLAAKKTEWNVVHAILADTYHRAESALAAAHGKLEAGAPARTELEALATLVSQLGNEGDASVAAIRKRLLDGGHHHHSSGEEQGVYDDGFVIVTRAAKKVFLDASKNIARMAGKPDKAALEAEWDKVAKQFAQLHAGGAH